MLGWPIIFTRGIISRKKSSTLLSPHQDVFKSIKAWKEALAEMEHEYRTDTNFFHVSCEALYSALQVLFKTYRDSCNILYHIVTVVT